MNSLINVSEGYIPNLGSLGPLLHVEKFVDGGWWKTKFSVHLSPKLNKKSTSHKHTARPLLPSKSSNITELISLLRKSKIVSYSTWEEKTSIYTDAVYFFLISLF